MSTGSNILGTVTLTLRIEATIRLDPEDSIAQAQAFAADVASNEARRVLLNEPRFRSCSVEEARVEGLAVDFGKGKRK